MKGPKAVSIATQVFCMKCQSGLFFVTGVFCVAYGPSLFPCQWTGVSFSAIEPVRFGMFSRIRLFLYLKKVSSPLQATKWLCNAVQRFHPIYSSG